MINSSMNSDNFDIPIFRVSRNYGEPNGVKTICHLASRWFNVDNHGYDLRNSFVEGASSRIEQLFDEFLDTHPDSDSQFVNYVQEKSDEFYVLEMNNIVDVTL